MGVQDLVWSEDNDLLNQMDLIQVNVLLLEIQQRLARLTGIEYSLTLNFKRKLLDFCITRFTLSELAVSSFHPMECVCI
jgi:hypothetical protein